jgi:hypothetical protein
MSVRCEQKAATLMASKMLEVELEKVDHSIADALGEIRNMVTGNFKNKISGLGDGCMLSPPSVITGDDYTVHSQPETPAPWRLACCLKPCPWSFLCTFPSKEQLGGYGCRGASVNLDLQDCLPKRSSDLDQLRRLADPLALVFEA